MSGHLIWRKQSRSTAALLRGVKLKVRVAIYQRCHLFSSTSLPGTPLMENKHISTWHLWTPRLPSSFHLPLRPLPFHPFFPTVHSSGSFWAPRHSSGHNSATSLASSPSAAQCDCDPPNGETGVFSSEASGPENESWPRERRPGWTGEPT